ncbi:hypothetical protein D3C72_2024730 [compost metagenome]
MQVRAAILVGQRDLDERAHAGGWLAAFPLPRVGQKVRAIDLLILATDDVLLAVLRTHHKSIAAAHARIGAGFQHLHATRAMPDGQGGLVGKCIKHPLARRADLAGHLQMKRCSFGHDLIPFLRWVTAGSLCVCSTKATSLSRLPSQSRR